MSHHHDKSPQGHELIFNTSAWSIRVFDRKTKTHVVADPDYDHELSEKGLLVGNDHILDMLDFYANKFPDQDRYHISADRQESVYVAKRRLQLPPSKKLRAVKKGND